MALPERIPLHILRERVDLACGLTNKTILKFSHFPPGLPLGSLIEVTGSAKVEWIVQFLKENEKLKIFWIEDKLTVLPTAIEQRGVSLERFVFVESGIDVFKPLRQALKSKVFGCAVVPRFTAEEKTLKVLQLLAEESKACVFLLAKTHATAWPLSIQLTVEKQREQKKTSTKFSVNVIKNKYVGIC